MSQILIQELIEQSLKNDNGMKACLGANVRFYDAPVKQSAYPYAVWRRWETKPIAGDYENAQEHIATIEIICKNTGIEEAKKAIIAIQNWAINAKPQSSEINIPLIISNYADVYRAVDGRTFLGVVRLKIISQNQ